MDKKLYRSSENSKICGVCGGIGEYFGVDPNIVRIAWIIFTVIFIVLGIILYVACVFLLPKKEDVSYSAPSGNDDSYNDENDDDILSF